MNNLRVAKVSGSGAASKLARICTVRKAIACILTVINQTQKAEIRKLYQVPLKITRTSKLYRSKIMKLYQLIFRNSLTQHNLIFQVNGTRLKNLDN